MAQGAFTDLVAAYSSPGRYYYTLQHIDLFAVAEPSAQHNLKAEIQSFAQLELMATKL
jgi:predicted metal-dependent HD superfamily phosphohydrolase